MMSPATNAIALTEITKQSYYKQFLKHKKKNINNETATFILIKTTYIKIFRINGNN